MASVTIDEIAIADDPDTWSAVGFQVTGDLLQLGSVRLRFSGKREDTGIVGWSLRGALNDQLDGLPTIISSRQLPREEPVQPNGVLGIDHVVAISPDLDRSIETLVSAGLDLRRIREEPTAAGAPRQAFFRLGPEILEVIQEPDSIVEQKLGRQRPLCFWGLALRVSDLERTVHTLSGQASEIRPAIQAGRSIASVRRSAGLAIPVALIS